MATAQKAAEVKQKLGKDTLDIDPAINAAIEAEKTTIETMKKKLEGMEEVLATPDLPKWMPERWGNQRLTIATPGTMQNDPFYIPEFVDVGISRRRVATHRWIRGQFHILTPDGQGKYRWCSKRRIPVHKMNGFRFSSYKDLFTGTGLFEEGSGDTVWNGDAVLMQVSMDGYERFRRQVEETRAFFEGSHGNEFFQLAQNAGVPSFREDIDRGVREFVT